MDLHTRWKSHRTLLFFYICALFFFYLCTFLFLSLSALHFYCGLCLLFPPLLQSVGMIFCWILIQTSFIVSLLPQRLCIQCCISFFSMVSELQPLQWPLFPSVSFNFPQLSCLLFFRVDPMPHDTPKPPGYTRFVCISDTHSRTDSIQMPYGDVFIHAGDFTELGLPSEVKKFNDWLGQHL